jgi:protein-S-isoprenylcysteine O-methyltransferase Ste14
MIQADTSWVAHMLADQHERAAQVLLLALYLPVALSALACALRTPRVRTVAAPLLSILWTLPTLLILQRLNLHYEWWRFDTHTPCMLGMPVALYLGWAIFWGALPQLAWPKLDVLSIAIVAFSFDFLGMFHLSPALELNRGTIASGYAPAWLVGEAVGIILVLVPAMLLFRWTENATHLGLRATGQVILSGLIFLYLIPELVFELRPAAPGWQPLLAAPPFLRQVWLQILFVFAVPGLSAVQEFVVRGRGTPLPFDPPRRLVVTGIYRYCANPMQFSCAVVMLAEAAMLRSAWLVAAAAMSTVYSVGLAHWDEDVDLAQRFEAGPQLPASGTSSNSASPYADWATYRAAVPVWRVRWRPFIAGPPATLYIAASCQTCSGIRAFLKQRNPAGLILCDAESLPVGSIRRLRYSPADAPPDSGVLAFARALEHLNFGWAFCGFLLRLPLIHHAAQLLTDVAGFGPRTPNITCSVEDAATTSDSAAPQHRNLG